MLDFGYYNMDCMDGMKEYPDKYFDLAVVDPPYGININMNIGLKKGQKKKRQQKDWDKSVPDDEYFRELFRVSQQQIIWGEIIIHIFHPVIAFLFGIKEKVCMVGVFQNVNLHGLHTTKAQEYINVFQTNQTEFTQHKNQENYMIGYLVDIAKRE